MSYIIMKIKKSVRLKHIPKRHEVLRKGNQLKRANLKAMIIKYDSFWIVFRG